MTFTNESTRDRVIRILAALALGYIAWITWPATISVVALVIGAIALATGVVGWCAAYALFDIRPRRRSACDGDALAVIRGKEQRCQQD
jgi:hypothetical protein